MFGEGSTDAEIHEHFVRYDQHFARLVAGVPIGLLGSARADRETLVQRLRKPWPRASAFIEDRRELLSRYVDDAEAARVRTSMLWASQANTIPAVFWALAFLLEHSEALAAILPEIDAAVRREEDGSPRLDLDARPAMRYFDSAILEMLRLCSGSISLRRVLAPLTLELADGSRCVLRPGDDLSVYPYLGHRDPEVFDEPECYRFDRFHVERGAKQFRKGGERLVHALLPFGGGESMCPGRFLAQNEIKMFIGMLLADYDVELMPGETLPGLDHSRSGLGLLPPDGPLRARLRRRAAR